MFKAEWQCTCQLTQLNIYPLLSFDRVIRAELTQALMTQHHILSACV